MDQHLEDFEVIDKQEIETSTEIAIIDNVNNNIEPAIIEDLPEANIMTSASTSDDNNNQANGLKYSRDELLKIKQEIAAINAPDFTTIVRNALFLETSSLDQTLSRNLLVRHDPMNSIMPRYANNMPTGRHSYQKQRSADHGGKRSYHGGKSQSQVQNQDPNEPQIHIKLQNEVKLNSAGENAWKPANMAAGAADMSEEDRQTEEIMRKFRGTLNKITPENFASLMKHVKVLEVNTSERLDKCIEIIFEKAIAEPNYASTYAKLAKEIAGYFVVEADQQKNSFKRRLISQCQSEFEKHRDCDFVKNVAQRLQDIEDEEDQAKKQILNEKYDEDNFKLRKRATGTVVFIGEMYKGQMLSPKIMLSCVSHLLDPSICSEETLECLCKLLTTIGKRLENENEGTDQKISLVDTFKQLEKIADKKNQLNISSRIRFMIQDLIDLRLNNWTPRRVENKPQTMEEIKNQVMMEQFVQSLDRVPSREGFYQGQGGRGGMQGKRGGMQGDDGWSTPYTKSRSMRIDMSKIVKPPATEDIKLGPSTNYQNFGNRFAGLKEEESVSDNSKRTQYNGRSSEGGNNSTLNRNSFGNNNSNSNNNNSARGGNRGGRSSSRNNSGYNTNNRFSNQHSRPTDLPMKTNTMPTRKMSAPARPQSYTAPILERHLITDPAETLNTIKKLLRCCLEDQVTISDVTDRLRDYKIEKLVLVDAYSWVFDQRDKEIFQLAEILCECVSRNVIMTKELLASLKEIFEIAQDLANDLPLIYRYLAQLIALPLLKRIVSIKDLLELSKAEIEFNNGGKILKEVFTIFAGKYEKQGLIQLYTESLVDFQLFLGDTKLDEFLQQHEFEYLIKPAAAELPKEQVTFELSEETRTKIQEMLRDRHDIDSMIAWINTHVTTPTDTVFIRFLTEAILQHCIQKTIDSSYEVNLQKLEHCSQLLSQYLDNDTDRELQCLYTIQRLINNLQHPGGVLSNILSNLYDSFALSKVGLFKWRDDENPQEQEGKGVALKSCTMFFELIKADEDSAGED